jgi:hypothetical protein
MARLASLRSKVTLPDGRPFRFWDDRTRYARVYHVAQRHPKASDDNPGTEKLPFKTIGRAAAILKPREKVVVHAGVYRECVSPARGGSGPAAMIAYEAAHGEEVCVRGSVQWKPAAKPSAGWKGAPPATGVWMADLPVESFGAYNPFLVRNVCDEFGSYEHKWTPEELARFLLRRGSVFTDGVPLRQVFRFKELAKCDGAFWVEEPGLRLHFRLPGDAPPEKVALEVSAHEQVFAPRTTGLGYIRVTGLRLEHAADGVPVPQRALISASRGHHWIIEDCRIRWANACGLDLGAESWNGTSPGQCGGHVIRRNVVADCGVCGIAGATGVDSTLVEDNVIERIGGLDIQRIWECAGLKFHLAHDVLIRRNVFRNIRHACGIWLDVLNRNCRITENVFAEMDNPAIHVEVTHDPNLIDRNLFWHVVDPGPADDKTAAGAIFSDSSEHLVIAHNFFGLIENMYAVSINLRQSDRMINGRGGLCRRNKVLDNVFHACPKRILLGGKEGENLSDGNFFDAAGDDASFCLTHSAPSVTRQNLAGWRKFFGLDRRSSQGAMEASFDPDSLVLTFKRSGQGPSVRPVKELGASARGAGPGPFTAREFARAASKGGIRIDVGNSPEQKAPKPSTHRKAR